MPLSIRIVRTIAYPLKDFPRLVSYTVFKLAPCYPSMQQGLPCQSEEIYRPHTVYGLVLGIELDR